MKVLLTKNAFDYKKGETIDVAANMARYLIGSGRADIPGPPVKLSKRKRTEAAARKRTRKRVASPLNKMTTATDNK